MSKLSFCLFALACLLTATSAFGQKKKRDFQTKSISVFKNNSAFLIKSGDVKTENGSYKMKNDFPAALYGTLWIHSPDKQLKNIKSFEEEETLVVNRNAESVTAMIVANLDKKMQVHLMDDQIHEGIIEELVYDGVHDPLITVPSTLPKLITLKSENQWVSFPINRVKKVVFLEKPNHLFESTTKETKRILQVDFLNKKQQQKLDMMYLAGGLNWSPIYLLELQNEQKARLTLRGELTNDAEDIENANINFVVGVPNFKFADKLTPLVNFLKNVPRPVNNWSASSNAMISQNISYEIQNNDIDVANPIDGAVEGSNAEDLYFYQLNNISLKKGGRGQYHVFEKEIDIAHIYESNLAKNGETKHFYQKEYLYSPHQKNKVIHSVKVNNNTTYPWTTGAVMVTNIAGKETQPISQDMLSYTPTKGHSFVKLTEVPDVIVKHAEKEIDRQVKAKKKPNNTRFFLDLITVEGKIQIKNYKSKAIDLNVRRAILGELIESSSKWLKAEMVNFSGNSNKSTNVCWETNVKAGEEIEIVYKYKIYVNQ